MSKITPHENWYCSDQGLNCQLQITATDFLCGRNIIFGWKILFLYNTISVRFIWILTYIWSFHYAHNPVTRKWDQTDWLDPLMWKITGKAIFSKISLVWYQFWRRRYVDWITLCYTSWWSFLYISNFQDRLNLSSLCLSIKQFASFMVFESNIFPQLLWYVQCAVCLSYILDWVIGWYTNPWVTALNPSSPAYNAHVQRITREGSGI